MARKPCAEDVEQLVIDCSFECLPSGRFRRIARNAILPFYYDCSVEGADIHNINQTCKKVFYIKNPQYFSGAHANNPGSQVVQNMRYAFTARNNSRVIDGRRQTKIIEPLYLCTTQTSVNWYSGPRETREFNYYNKLRDNCICPHPGGRILRN